MTKRLLIIFLTCIALHLCYGWANLQFNPLKWSADARGLIIAFGLLYGVIAQGVYMEIKKDNGQD
jgi:hypothetical protein